MLKDVSDGLKMVAEAIKNVREIAQAVKSGKDYVKATHPEVQTDLRNMINELGKSLNVIKQASAVLTNFRFAVTTDAGATELARFNDYFIKSKTETQDLRNHIDDLRTHCHTVREHANRIMDKASSPSFEGIFALLGLKSLPRELELAGRLRRVVEIEGNVADSADIMLECLEKALKDVQAGLGDAGAMYAANIPKAAALLGEYGSDFAQMEEHGLKGADEMRELAKALST